MAVDFHGLLSVHDHILSESHSESSSTESESIINGFGSCGSCSSVGSEMSSTKTQCDDEDDFIDELTRQMAENMLQEDEQNSAPHRLSSKPKLKDDKSMEDEGSFHLGRQEKVTELTQPKQKVHSHMENKVRACGFGNGGRVRVGPQQQGGSGMRAIFLGKSGSKSGSLGTGVFLPRGITSTPSESQKKSACSTVLIPARVLQTLKLHFDDISRSSGFSASSPNHLNKHDVVGGRYRYDMYSQQKRQPQVQHTQIQPEILNEHEIGLPHEWTY